jgi:hypothetical protein
MLEAANNPGMEKPALQTLARGGSGSALSLAYSGLGEGRWFWRVSPVFTDEYQGNVAPSAAASFTVTKSGALEAPLLLTPRPDATLSVAAADRQDIYFAWQNEAEADSYTLLISPSADLRNPLIERRTRDNYAVYASSETPLAEGRYYWGVCQTDGEGTVSALSPSRAFDAVSETPVPRPLSPPQTPEPPPPDPEPPPPPVAVIPAAAPVEREPPPPPLLPEPGRRLPANGYRVGPEQLREFRSIRFSWERVAGADSYIFALYKDEGGERRFIQRWASTRNSHDLNDLTLLENGRFIWEVEALNQGSGGPVRRGRTGANSFTVDIPPIRRHTANSPGAVYGR